MSTINTALSAFSSTYLTSLEERTFKEALDLEKLFILERDEYFYNPFTLPHHDEVTIARLVSNPGYIQPFFHPIVYFSKHEKVNHKPKLYIFSDCRAFYNNKAQTENKIKNLSDFSFITLRSQLDGNWIVDKEAFNVIKDFVIDTFSNWVGNLLNRNINTSLYTISQWKMVLAIYYLSFFIDDVPKNKDILKAYFYKTIPKITRVPTTMLDELFANFEEDILSMYLNQQQFNPNYVAEHGHVFKKPIISLCEMLSKITLNTIVINHHMLFNLVATAGVITSQSAQVNAVSLENPSTFITMMYYARMKGINSNSKLGNEIKSIANKHDGNLFDTVLNRITLKK